MRWVYSLRSLSSMWDVFHASFAVKFKDLGFVCWFFDGIGVIE